MFTYSRNFVRRLSVATAALIILNLPLAAQAGFTTLDSASLQELALGDTLMANSTVFSDWSINNNSASGGALPINPADVEVAAGIDSAGSPALRYLMTAAAASGQIIGLDFQYRVTAPQPLVTVGALLDAAAASGNGVVSLGDTLFGTFPGPPVGTLSATTLNVDTLYDTTDIDPPLTSYLVRKDLILSGGVSGTASLSSMFQFYVPVPEPCCQTLWFVGLMGFSCQRRRWRRTVPLWQYATAGL